MKPLGDEPDEAWAREQFAKLNRLESARQPVPYNLSADKANRILASLYADEPFFIFRAKDILSTLAIDEYAKWVEKFHPDSPQLISLVDEANRFRAWQVANPDKIKLPD